MEMLFWIEELCLQLTASCTMKVGMHPPGLILICFAPFRTSLGAKPHMLHSRCLLAKFKPPLRLPILHPNSEWCVSRQELLLFLYWHSCVQRPFMAGNHITSPGPAYGRITSFYLPVTPASALTTETFWGIQHWALILSISSFTPWFQTRSLALVLFHRNHKIGTWPIIREHQVPDQLTYGTSIISHRHSLSRAGCSSVLLLYTLHHPEN